MATDNIEDRFHGHHTNMMVVDDFGGKAAKTWHLYWSDPGLDSWNSQNEAVPQGHIATCKLCGYIQESKSWAEFTLWGNCFLDDHVEFLAFCPRCRLRWSQSKVHSINRMHQDEEEEIAIWCQCHPTLADEVKYEHKRISATCVVMSDDAEEEGDESDFVQGLAALGRGISNT